jgi:hypothetical protein
MQRFSGAFSRAATKLSYAATRTAQDYQIDSLPDEPTFTGALAARMMDALRHFNTSGIHWSARVLSSHGPNTEETEFGADFLGLLSLNLPGYNVRKGFLAQAKRQEPGSRLSRREWERLQQQCGKMLSYSPESYVFIYSINGVFMVPAISVVACAGVEDLHTLHPKKTGAFYREHFECYVGDKRMDSDVSSVLADLMCCYGPVGARPSFPYIDWH